MSDLILPMKGVYFDQILRGEKTEEYRLATPYWGKRLGHGVKWYDRLILTRGYPKGGGVEGVTRMTMPYNGNAFRQIQHDHFGPGPVWVYAIKAAYSPLSATQGEG